MDTLAIRRVAVWLDSLAPDRGAFAHALDWAGHLNLPLRIFAARTQAQPVIPSGAEAVVDCDTGAGDLAPTIQACVATCDYSKVPLDPASWCGPVDIGVREFLSPTELCVFGGALPPPEMDTLLRSYAHHPGTAALVCPRTWQPVTRVLVLNERRDPGGRFLDSVAWLCHEFQVRPVVLTVAPSDSEAKLRRHSAEQALGARGLSGDFDCAVGCRVRSAVAWAASWRRCSHVFVEKRDASSWWHWLRGGTVESLLGLSDTLALLALPGATALFGACGAANRDTRPAGGDGHIHRQGRPSNLLSEPDQ